MSRTPSRSIPRPLERLQVFDASTVPLLDYYARRETLVRIDGNNPVPDVTRSAITHLDHERRRLGLEATTAPEPRQPALAPIRPIHHGQRRQVGSASRWAPASMRPPGSPR
jgi:hypothetical protein